jgi:hypothetical protein
VISRIVILEGVLLLVLLVMLREIDATRRRERRVNDGEILRPPKPTYRTRKHIPNINVRPRRRDQERRVPDKILET